MPAGGWNRKRTSVVEVGKRSTLRNLMKRVELRHQVEQKQIISNYAASLREVTTFLSTGNLQRKRASGDYLGGSPSYKTRCW